MSPNCHPIIEPRLSYKGSQASKARHFSVEYGSPTLSISFVVLIDEEAASSICRQILDAIEDPTPHAMARAYVYALLTLVCSLLKNQTDMQHLWFGRQAVTRTRSILMGAVFDKAMKRKDFSGITTATKKGENKGKISIKKAALEWMGKGEKGKDGSSAKAGAGADIGKIVNLMSADASKVSQILGQVYNLYGAPFEIIVGTLFLYQLLGISAFFGFVALLSIAPLNNYLSKRRIFISRGIATARDRRMAVVNELFTYIKFIKLCAWDDRWIKRTEKARKKEIKWILRERLNVIMLGFLWTIAPILVSFCSFLAFVLLGNELTVSIAFTSIVLFNLLRQPLNVLPNFVAQLLQARVSLDRISAFFAEDEVDDAISTLKMKEDSTDASPKDATLGIIGNVNFVWNSIEPPKSDAPAPRSSLNQQDIQVIAANGSNHRAGDTSPTDTESVPSSVEARFELQDINIIFPEGELTLVTGATASGKTALLLAQLGEMTMSAPSEVTINPRILLPKYPHAPPDEYGLRPCVSYAAQSPWLEHLSIRDNILFGEPFDSERYWEVIESCALKTDLEILEDGDFTEIGERGISLSGGQKARVALARAVYVRSKIVLLDDPLSAVDSHTARFLGYHIWFVVLLLIGVTQLFGFLDKYWIKVWGEAYDDTKASLGVVSQVVLTIFVHSKHEAPTPDNQASPLYPFHVNPHLPQIDTKTLPSANRHPLFYVAIYGAIGVGGVVLTSINTIIQYSGAIRASKSLFLRLLNGLVRATFRFHDTTPTGRILNRLSRDMEVIDSSVSDSLRAVIFRVSTFIASMVVVAYIFPLFLIPATIISYFYVHISKGYINAGRDMRRMQSTTRSPIFAAFAETLEGIVTVRAFGAERRFLAILMQRIDLTTKLPPVLHGVTFTLNAGEKIGLLGRTGSGKSTLAMSLLRFVEPSEGAIFIDGIDITSIGLKDLRSRVTIIPQDSVLFSGTLRENLDPFEEHTDSECLDALYRVHLLTPGARVRPPTITVGGSGTQSPGRSKSSILNRPLTPEPEPLGHEEGPETSKTGFIRADTFLAPAPRNNHGSNTPSSVDGSSNDEYVPRHMSTEGEINGYRYGLVGESTIVSPSGALSPVGRLSTMVHFADSGRFPKASESPLRKDDSSRSLDPDVNATFAAAGRRRYNTRSNGGSGALSRSGTISEGPILTLDTQVASGGANFSNGQRQLISMARALLRRNSIVILDEATSSIDFETDAKIQATVREEFNSSCLLTIAHRIRTVIDYDRLIVLDKGRIQEFDTPWNLIQKEGGIFRDMCIKSGQMRELEALAKAKAQEHAHVPFLSRKRYRKIMAVSAEPLKVFDTNLPADSVEFCPSLGYQEYFVCGTYQLQQEAGSTQPNAAANDEGVKDVDGDKGSKAQTRFGRCILLNIFPSGEFEHLQNVDMPAILDMKWFLIVSRESHSATYSPRLAIADAVGKLRFYELKDALDDS
ncbi:hypothetical protein FRC17_010930 [Serendipita sp. 399]|nr:hypothetical protein FRC17_010930 [Serendipita sp. 399]